MSERRYGSSLTQDARFGPITEIADQQTTLGEPIDVALAITDENTSTVTSTATSSDEQIVPNSGLAVTGNGATQQITITPTSETPGTTTVTLTAEDEAGRTSSRAFDVTVAEPFPTPNELTTENDTPIGTAVAISEKYAVAGAFESVYVFERVEDAWVEMQRLTPAAMPALPIDFGWAVDVDGERIIVGADEDNEGGERAGAAYIFELIGGSWTQTKKLVDTLPADFDSMGRSVALNGDYAFVGAQGDVQDGIDSGSVFVFQYFELGGWTLLTILNPEDAQDADIFGESVDSDGDSLIVGNYGDPKRGTEAGSVYVFRFDGAVWHQVAKLTSPSPAENAEFGWDVGISGENIIAAQVGTPMLAAIFAR